MFAFFSRMDQRQWLCVFVFLTSLLFFSCHLGDRPIFTRGEGREAIVVKAMLAERNFILPLRNGEDIPSKPPMFHWLSVLSSGAVGKLNEFSMRLPSTFCGALTVTMLFAVMLPLYGETVSGIAALILSTTFEFMRSTTHARVDMCFTFFLAAALLLTYHNISLWNNERKYSWTLLLLCSLATAGAILAKGPTALLIICAVAAVYLIVISPKPRLSALRELPWLPFLIAISLAIIVGGLWYWAAYLEHGDRFLRKQLFQENFARMVNVEAEDVGHKKPFYFSLIELTVGFLPWSFFFPLITVEIWKTRRHLFSFTKRLELFSLIWLMVFLLAVTLSQSKRSVYLLPAYPALALLASTTLVRVSKGISDSRRCLIFTSVMTFLLALVLFVVVGLWLSALLGIKLEIYAQLLPVKLAVEVARGVDLLQRHQEFVIDIFVAALILVGVSRLVLKCRLVPAATLLASVVLLIWMSATKSIVPAIASTGDPREFITTVDRNVPKDAKLVLYRTTPYAAQFYIDRNIPYLETTKSLKNESGYIIVREDQLMKLTSELPQSRLMLTSFTKADNGRQRLFLMKFENLNQYGTNDDYGR